MRLYLNFIILAGVLYSCGFNSGSGRNNKASESKIRKEVISFAEDYLSKQFKNARKSVASDIITLSDEQKSYIIDPAKVFIGLIDDDADQDAIVSVTCYQGQNEVPSEHLVILWSSGKYLLVRAIESDMKILQLKDRVIIAKVPTHSRNSPLFNCEACQEIVKYQLKDGDLVRMQ